MNLTSWLNELAAAYPQHDLTKLQIFEYRQELETWSLDPEEWLELKSLARRRHLFFPSIGELEEIMHEVKRNTAAGKNGGPIWETFQGEDGLVYARRSK
jgi:hypothetical protein